MPKGYPGTVTHGVDAYRKNRCRCREICLPAWREYRRSRRKTGAEPARGRKIQADEHIAILEPMEARLLRALLHDGADMATVAQRCNCSEETARRTILTIAQHFGYTTRMELVVGLLRGDVGFRVASNSPQRNAA